MEKWSFITLTRVLSVSNLNIITSIVVPRTDSRGGAVVVGCCSTEWILMSGRIVLRKNLIRRMSERSDAMLKCLERL